MKPLNRRPPALHTLRNLLAAGSLSLLVACGGSTDDADSPPPTIASQPADVQATAGGEARFSASALGSDLKYQWQRSSDGGQNWANIGSATSSTLVISSLSLSDSNSIFRVVISQGGSEVISSAAKLTVASAASPVAITVQPAALQVTAGANASFSVTATGSALAYQWQSSADGSAWLDIAGATEANLLLSSTTAAQSGNQYRVVIRNSLGTVNSAAVALTVTAAPALPSFSTQPVSAAVTAPASASFTVQAQGSPAPSYQWQRSTDQGSSWSDISGAVNATYTTAATSESDSGSQYRVLASNASGTTTSLAVQLNVTAAPVPVVITEQPTDLSVAVSQTATWSVRASGSPSPSYQWQLSTDGGASYANINGATQASYSLLASSADNGRLFRVLVSNSQGTVISRAGRLTVAVGPMLNRNWALGQSLEENSSAVLVKNALAAIDDVGRVTVLFRKSNGQRDVLYATRGTPNGLGSDPTWTPPVAIDLVGNKPVSYMPSAEQMYLTAAPGGDVVALWNHSDTCTTDSYAGGPSIFLCRYYYFSRYRIANDRWDAPTLLTDVPDGAFTAVLTNDRGDLAVMGNSWVPYGNLKHTAVPALFLKSGTEPRVRRQLLSNVPTQAFREQNLSLDRAGNLLLVSEYAETGNAQIRAWRGTVDQGLVDSIRLDDQPSGAALRSAAMGLNGQQIVTWWHPDLGTESYGAASPSPTAPFTVTKLNSIGSYLSINDQGMGIACNAGCRLRTTWTESSGWTPQQSTGALFFIFDSDRRQTASSRNGDLLWVGSGGDNATYDAALNRAVIANNDPRNLRYVLGLSKAGVGFAKPVLSVSGVGFVLMRNQFDVLPTPTLPEGVLRPVSTSSDTPALWGSFLK